MVTLVILLFNWNVVASESETFGAPILLWPLSDKTFLSEVREGAAQNNIQCGLMFDTALHNYLHCQPLKFDGDTRPYVDLHVELSSGQTNLVSSQTFFTFSFNANAAGSEVCLFDYRGTGSGSGHTKISVWIKADGKICFSYVTTKDVSSTACDINKVMPGQWQFVSVGVDLVKGNIRIGVDGPYTAKADPRLVSTKNIDLPGILRLGSDGKDTKRFQGMITCLSLYQGLVPYKQQDVILNRCFWGTSVWNVLPTGLPTAPSTEGCHGTQGAQPNDNYYTKHADDVIPVEKETESLATDTVYRCVARCSRLSTCQSCAFVKPKICLLYELQHRAPNLKSMPKYRYYYRRKRLV